MNAQEILQDQFQLDFKTDLPDALNVGGGIYAHVSNELGKLTNKLRLSWAKLSHHWVKLIQNSVVR